MTTGNSPAFRVSGLDPTGARVKSIHQGREKCLRWIGSVSTTSGHRQARHAWLELADGYQLVALLYQCQNPGEVAARQLIINLGHLNRSKAKTSSPEPHYHLPAFLRDPNFTVKPLGACVVCARTAVAAGRALSATGSGQAPRCPLTARLLELARYVAHAVRAGYHLPWTVSQLVGVPPALVKSGKKPQGQRHIDGWRMVWR
ncbi:hypothetical protein C8R44DRAFT_894224 [Mycena epipterygia]|nr:hypothetical protein C8R44DRAFT_894224 [Mycena epipterygia]